MNFRKITAIITTAMLMFSAGCNDTINGRKRPTPVDAVDVNTVTFDDDEYFFARIINDEGSSEGELSVSELSGNKMLKFSDSGKTMSEQTVQKIEISAVQLLSPEDLEKVRSIEFDLYADAVDSLLVTENGKNVKAPGWIGGGGGTVDANEKWYDFAEFSGEEYDFDVSGACHVTFKFLLADSGKKWSSEMEDANFLIMRWGLQNISDTYIDNIVFYDADGNSIPLNPHKVEITDTSEKDKVYASVCPPSNRK